MADFYFTIFWNIASTLFLKLKSTVYLFFRKNLCFVHELLLALDLPENAGVVLVDSVRIDTLSCGFDSRHLNQLFWRIQKESRVKQDSFL